MSQDSRARCLPAFTRSRFARAREVWSLGRLIAGPLQVPGKSGAAYVARGRRVLAAVGAPCVDQAGGLSTPFPARSYPLSSRGATHLLVSMRSPGPPPIATPRLRPLVPPHRGYLPAVHPCSSPHLAVRRPRRCGYDPPPTRATSLSSSKAAPNSCQRCGGADTDKRPPLLVMD